MRFNGNCITYLRFQAETNQASDYQVYCMASFSKLSAKPLVNNQILLHIAGLTLAVVTVYWPTYRFDFLYGWDDQWFVTNNYTESGLNWQNLWDILTHFHYGQYAPLNQLYYTILYTLFGYNTGYFHIAGVCVHLANVILVYKLINTMTPAIYGEDHASYASAGFVTAFIFAVMPINVEPVAWVAASKVTIYAFCYLLSLICYSRYLILQKPRYFYLTLLFFILSFGAKEQAVTLPLCLVLFDYLFNRKLSDRMVWLEKLPFIIVTLLFGIATIQSQGIEGNAGSFYPVYQRLPLAFYTLSEYFTKTLVPVNLSFLYPFPFLVGEEAPWWLSIYVLLITVIVYCFFHQMKAKWLYFGILFFFIHIVLVINIFPLARHSVIADRYAYVAAIGISFILSRLFLAGLKRRAGRRPVLITGVLYIVVLTVYASSHIGVWSSAFTLKERLKMTIEQRDDFEELKKLK